MDEIINNEEFVEATMEEFGKNSSAKNMAMLGLGIAAGILFSRMAKPAFRTIKHMLCHSAKDSTVQDETVDIEFTEVNETEEV